MMHDVPFKRQQRAKLQKQQTALFWRQSFMTVGRRGGMILFNDILLRDDQNEGLNPDPYLTSAISALLVNAPLYPTMLKLYFNDTYTNDFSWKRVFQGGGVGESASSSSTTMPAAAARLLNQFKTPQFSAFAGHCAVSTFFFANWFGRYYVLVEKLDASFEQQDKAAKNRAEKRRRQIQQRVLDENGNEVVVSSSSGIGNDQQQEAAAMAQWKRLGLCFIAAELSRLWAVLLSAPLETVRTHLNENIYSTAASNNFCYPTVNPETGEKFTAEQLAEQRKNNPNPRYKGFGDCASKLMKEGGMKKMWGRARGQYYRVSGVLTSACLVGFERMRNYYQPRKRTDDKKKIDWKELGIQ